MRKRSRSVSNQEQRTTGRRPFKKEVQSEEPAKVETSTTQRKEKTILSDSASDDSTAGSSSESEDGEVDTRVVQKRVLKSLTERKRQAKLVLDRLKPTKQPTFAFLQDDKDLQTRVSIGESWNNLPLSIRLRLKPMLRHWKSTIDDFVSDSSCTRTDGLSVDHLRKGSGAFWGLLWKKDPVLAERFLNNSKGYLTRPVLEKFHCCLTGE